jgi:hypothetical protein
VLKSKLEPYEIREWRSEDQSSWLECQRASFGHERAKSAEDWEFLMHPLGLPGRGIVATLEERVVASYVGIPTRTWFGGEERICVQAVDLMLHPDLRQGLGGQRLHRGIAERFFALYGDGQGDLMHYGWPIAPAARFGRRLLAYEFVREELCLVRETLPNVSADPGVQVLHEVGQDLRWLWDRCAGEWGLSTIRDGDWARRRFLEHPSVDYTLLGVREEGILRGMCVLRETPWHWEGATALCDWLVPADEPEVARRLQAAAFGRAATMGSKRLVCLLPESSRAFALFQEHGWHVQSTPYQLLLRSFDRRLDADWVRQHAWLTLADSDLA